MEIEEPDENENQQKAQVVKYIRNGATPAVLVRHGYCEQVIAQAIVVMASVDSTTPERMVIERSLNWGDHDADSLVEDGFDPIDVSSVIQKMEREDHEG